MSSTPVPPRRPDRPEGPGDADGNDATGRSGSRPRRRDRHGRGMRGPLAPPQVPLAVTRAEFFDDLVRDSISRLERHWPQLSEVEFAVQEVPRTDGEGEDGSGPVPLGHVSAAEGGRPDRIVVYRRPVELRTRNRDDRALLVHEIVVEQVAELLGLAPESVDPRYGQD